MDFIKNYLMDFINIMDFTQIWIVWILLLILDKYGFETTNTNILIYITVLASTTVDLYFLHYFHLHSSEVVQLVQFKFKIF